MERFLKQLGSVAWYFGLLLAVLTFLSGFAIVFQDVTGKALTKNASAPSYSMSDIGDMSWLKSFLSHNGLIPTNEAQLALYAVTSIVFLLIGYKLALGHHPKR